MRPRHVFRAWSHYVARTQRPILVGPWREEIGSEVLYWLPFLAQWCHTYHIAPDRLMAISRGGAAAWYPAGATRVELYDYWPPEALRLESLRASAATGSIKQTAETALERTLYPTIAARLGLRRYHVLHPQALYAAIRGWADNTRSLADLMAHLRFAPLPAPPALPLSVALPERFACVRFYQRPTWMLSDEVRDYCGQLVGTLATQIPVVVIGSRQHHDEHLDLAFHGAGVTDLIDAFPARDNLALQSAVLAKSQCFVGTYGGTMQLAVRLGIPSCGFYQAFRGTAYGHKILTDWLAMQQHTPIWIGTPAQAELVRTVVSVPLELPQPVSSSSGVLG